MHERLRRDMADKIAKYGRTVIGVFPDEDSTDPTNDAFAYSIGNASPSGSRLPLPELLVVGMCNDTWTINTLSEMMIARGRKFDDGEIVNLGGPQSVCVVDAAESVKDRYMIRATNWHGGEDRYAVMQVVLPDPAGRFPWQEGCAEPYCRVIVHRRKLH